MNDFQKELLDSAMDQLPDIADDAINRESKNRYILYLFEHEGEFYFIDYDTQKKVFCSISYPSSDDDDLELTEVSINIPISQFVS